MLEPMKLERWNCTIAMVQDPDGYALEIVQNEASSAADECRAAEVLEL